MHVRDLSRQYDTVNIMYSSTLSFDSALPLITIMNVNQPSIVRLRESRRNFFNGITIHLDTTFA